MCFIGARLLFDEIWLHAGGEVPGFFRWLLGVCCDENSGNRVLCGAGEPFFLTHEEECFGEKVGSFGRCGDGGDGEEIE